MSTNESRYFHFKIRKQLVYALIILTIVAPFSVVAAIPQPVQRILYESIFCTGPNQMMFDGSCFTYNVYVVAWHKDGTVFYSSATHNILTNLGKNVVKTNLGTGSNQTTALYIQLTNATFTPAATSNYCCGGLAANQILQNYGLAAAIGTYTSTGTGTWTVTKTFNNTGSIAQTVYGAGLTTTATQGIAAVNNFAEATFSASVTLQPSDQVAVTWSLTAS